VEDILRNSLYALIEQPQPVSSYALPKLLADEAYRTEALPSVRNPSVFDFFHNTYDRLNKWRAFTTDPLLRAVIGQPRSSFDFRRAMDHRKIILCDLSKGAIGTDNAMILGSLIVMQEKLAALSRADIPAADRVPHLLVAEEPQNFISDSESILAEQRAPGPRPRSFRQHAHCRNNRKPGNPCLLPTASARRNPDSSSSLYIGRKCGLDGIRPKLSRPAASATGSQIVRSP